MQIGHNVLGNAHLQDNVRLDSAKMAEQAGKAESSADISGLREGAVFKGEILDIIGDKVKIALNDHAQLMARLQAGVELGVGDQLLFSVKENTANQILIKPMFDSLYSAQTQVLEKALDMAGLSPTEKNFSAAKELMDAGMPVDKGNIVKLLSQSMKFEGTSMQTLAALNKMDIPVTEENIAQYERYQGCHHQLSGDISQTADSMAAFTDAFPKDTSGTTLLFVANRIMELFMEEPQNEIQEAVQSVSEDIESHLADGASLAKETVLAEETGKEAGLQKENVGIGQGSAQVEENIAKQEIDTDKGQIAKQEIDTDKGQVTKQEIDTDKGQITKQEIKTVNNTQAAEQPALSKGETANLANALQKAGVPNEQIRQIVRDFGTSEDLLKNMIQALNRSGGNDAAVRSILDSREFKKLFADVVKKNWSLNPKDMKEPKEIDELYNKILRQGKAFEEAVATKGGDTKNFSQNFQNMRQNMQFMEQLNQQMIYAQMPLKLSNKNANSELFVYADKRKLAEKKDGISVMLHLDMDHLGMTDIKVTLTGTNVNARFYLNDQESVDIVADNMGQLAKQLADRGFSLTNEVVKRSLRESVNKVVDEIIDENAERSIKRYTFDART